MQFNYLSLLTKSLAVELLLLLLLTAGVSLIAVTPSGLGSTLPNITLVSPADLSNTVGIACSSALDVSRDIGEWRNPNGTKVGTLSSSNPLYTLFRINRVELFRRAAITSDQEGIYTCSIPDEEETVQTLYVGIYTSQSHQGDSKSDSDVNVCVIVSPSLPTCSFS